MTARNIVLMGVSVVAIGFAGYSIYGRLHPTEEIEMVVYPRPAYANFSIEVVRQAAVEDIKSHQNEIKDLFAEREKLSLQERYSLVTDAPVRLLADFNKEKIEFYTPLIVGNYLETTSDSTAVQAQCRPFLEQLVLWHSGMEKDETKYSEAHKAAQESGSKDPIVQLALLVMADLSNELPKEEALKAYSELDDMLDDPRISTFNRAYLAHLIHSQHVANSSRVNMEAYLYRAIDEYVNYLEMEASQKSPRIPWSLFEGFFGRLTVEEKLVATLACLQSEKIPWWTKHMTAGSYLHAVAWDHRGTGFANTVSDEQFDAFRRYDQMAEGHFLRAWQLAPQYPEAATMMIQLAMAGNSSRWDNKDWFYESVRGQFDHYEAYQRYLYSVSPRWGGSYEDMLDVAIRCIETERYDTFVPGIYLHVVFDNMVGERGQLDEVARNKVVSAAGVQLAKGLSAAVEKGVRSPTDNLLAWGNLARIMVLSGEYETARMIYEKHSQGSLGTGVLSMHGMKSSLVRGLTFASTGPAKAEVAVFEKLLNSPQQNDPSIESLEQLDKTLQEVRAKDTQAESQPFFDDVATVIGQMKKYHSDEWVDLPFDEKFTGWSAHASDLAFPEPGVLELKSVENDLGIQLTPLARFRPPFMCEVELERFGDEYSLNYLLYLIYGDDNRGALYSRQEPRALYIKPGYSFFGVLDGTDRESQAIRNWTSTMTKGKYQHLRLIVWNDRVEFYGDRDFLTVLPMPEGANRDRFTIGELMPVSKPNLLRARNVRIRRLRMTPPPLGESFQAIEHTDYYKALVELDPLCPGFLLQAGQNYYHARQYDEAARCYEQALKIDPGISRQRETYGSVLVQLKRHAEAIEQYQAVLAVDQNAVHSFAGLAWVYATAPDEKLRNGAEALQLAEKGCALSNRQDWNSLVALAAARAELGQWDDAQKVADEALAAAPQYYREFTEQAISKIKARKPLWKDDESSQSPSNNEDAGEPEK